MKLTHSSRCIHCLEYSEKITKDHIFPKAWYPENTPGELDRWTAPSCIKCNSKLGEAEEELFIRLGMCLWHDKEVPGIRQRMLRALGVGAQVDEKELTIRKAKLNKIWSEVIPYPEKGEGILPRFGAPQGYETSQLKGILVPADLLTRVGEKIVRGLEYKLGNERYVEQDYILETYIINENSAPEVDHLIDSGSILTHSPGFRIARNSSTDPKTVLYRIEIWGTLFFHGSIFPRAD